MTLESAFKSKLVEKLEKEFPGCVILKNDANQKQAIPDMLILFENKWAALEVKRSRHAPLRPNQDFWVNYLDNMSYASFIYPENMEEVLDEIRATFGT